MISVRILGGPYDGFKVEILGTPPRIQIKDCVYDRIDDPDTGEFLGGYVVGHA